MSDDDILGQLKIREQRIKELMRGQSFEVVALLKSELQYVEAMIEFGTRFGISALTRARWVAGAVVDVKEVQ